MPAQPLPSRPWRLRFVIPDEPGRLAAAATSLADLGVNILNLDVQIVGPGEVLDEATVALPFWIDVPAIEHALRTAGARQVWATPVPMQDVVDIPTRMLRLAAAGRLADSPEQITDLLAELLAAELVWAESPLTDGRPGTSGDPTFDRRYIKRLPAAAEAWTMAVPDPAAPTGRAFVAARRFAPFTLADATRASALLAACLVPDRDRVTGPTYLSVRPLRPSQRSEVIAMHERCSASSRYRRYFSSMTTVRTDIIDCLLEPRPGRVSLGAWAGDRLVGIGNGCPMSDDPQGHTMELAVLVADDHQNRGIGTLLMAEMVAEARQSDVRDFVVITLPDNHAMAHVTRRVAGAVGSSTDGDTITLRFSAA